MIKTKEERDMEVIVSAAQELIRVHQAKPFNNVAKKSTGSDTTSQKLEIELKGEERVFIITSMSAIDRTTASKNIALGVDDGAKVCYYTEGNTGENKISVDYLGQILAGEGSIVVANFKSVGASDSLEFAINGYWIRE